MWISFKFGERRGVRYNIKVKSQNAKVKTLEFRNAGRSIISFEVLSCGFEI